MLIVDDAPASHALFTSHLRELNVHLPHAYTGGEALALAADQRPDLILLEVCLPDMSGFDVCRELKEARIDGLTGVPNRRYFDWRLTQGMARARRGHQRVGLVRVDVDHFKQINDTLGHPIGDQTLCRVSELVTATCRISDVPCRYGGDEFALILPDADVGECMEQATRLLGSVREDPRLTRLVNRPVTVSLGCASADAAGDIDIAGLIQRTDEALYSAKAAGRNRVAAYNDEGRISAAAA